MLDNSHVLFIDSGIGGLTILKRFLEVKSNVNIIYYADTKNFPYGEKTQEEIDKILFDVYKIVSSFFNISLIVIACNTGSVSALSYLREKVKDINIIGTVPAIKPASSITKNNRIGVVATKTTVNLNYINELIKKFGNNNRFIIKESNKLVEAIESFFDESQIKKIIEKEFKIFKEENIDVLVLGCTHYSFIKNEIRDYFNNKVEVIDSIEGIVNRILALLPLKSENENPEKILIISKSTNGIYEKYNKLNEDLKLFNKIIKGEELCPKV